LGISEDVPVGYQDIRVYFKIDADIADEEKEELVRTKRSLPMNGTRPSMR